MLLLCLFAGACRLTQQSQDAANAVRQLDRARVAVFVKAPRNEYDLVLDTARRGVTEKLPLFPDGPLKQEIVAALEAYNDAGKVWERQDNSDSPVAKDELPAIWAKYDLTKRLADAPPAPTPPPAGVMPAPQTNVPPESFSQFAPPAARALIWQTAEEHLNKAKELLTKENRIF